MKTEVIYLINKEGIVNTYQNKAEAFNKLGYNFIVYSLAIELASPDRDKIWDGYANRRFAKKKHEGLGQTYGELYKKLNRYGEMKVYGDFILKNEYNEQISVLDFAEFVFKEKKEKTYVGYGKEFWNGEGAVPHTGKRGRYRYRRKPQTLSLLKDATSEVDEDEIEFNVKNRRPKGFITTAWDDEGRSDWRIRNWKRHRNTQYK
jgi:hypothetical protein